MRRNTLQKDIIFQAIYQLGHATKDQIIDVVTKKYQSISVATVYRNLNVMLQDHQIKCIKMNELEDIYETVKHLHHHFVCKKCGDIIDIDPQMLPSEVLSEIAGNKIEEQQITLYGVCKICQQEDNREDEVGCTKD